MAALTITVVRAQQVTFASAEFEEGLRDFLDIDDDTPILQSQMEEMTTLRLNGMGITDIQDIVYFPKLRELDLSGNRIGNLTPLLVLDSLRVLDISDNGLESINRLLFTNADSLEVNVARNHITDFSAFAMPTECQFTLWGLDTQSAKDAPYLKVTQLYAKPSENGCLAVVVSGLSNDEEPANLVCGGSCTKVMMDGDIHEIEIAIEGVSAQLVKVTNGVKGDSTYVVPVSFYPTETNEAITIETGLPEKYRIDNAGAQYGTAVIDGTKLNYTAPDERTPDVVAFSYYEGAHFRGYGYVIAGMQYGDVNADGKVTIADAEGIVSKILGVLPANFVERAADVNHDANITITDAVGVLNIIMNSGGDSAPQLDIK
jgi:hypothetical protein